MNPVLNKNIYDTALISKIKKQTGQKKLKKIIKNLKNLAERDLKESSGLKIKIFVEKKEETKKPEIQIISPVIGFSHYFEDLQKTNSKHNEAKNYNENTPSTVEGNEKDKKQIDSSDLSDDE